MQVQLSSIKQYFWCTKNFSLQRETEQVVRDLFGELMHWSCSWPHGVHLPYSLRTFSDTFLCPALPSIPKITGCLKKKKKYTERVLDEINDRIIPAQGVGGITVLVPKSCLFNCVPSSQA